MRLLIACLILCLSSLMNPVRAQQKDIVYFLDADRKPVKEKKATWLLHVVYDTVDSCWRYSYYNKIGPLIRIESYRDAEAKVRQGLFAWYNAGGQMDSSGYYYKGLPDKRWLYSDGKKAITKSRLYDKGILIKETDHSPQKPVAGLKDTSELVTNPEIESAFPGGQQEWLRYLNHNFRYPDRAVNNEVKGEVRIWFIVDTAGKIIDPQVIKSVEFSLDEQSLWTMRNSPDWVPAVQNGKWVKSFKVQPMIFELSIYNRR